VGTLSLVVTAAEERSRGLNRQLNARTLLPGGRKPLPKTRRLKYALCMTMNVHSPHSGHPVKIRDEDIGRAVRDEENRIFYVVPRANGEGYYGAITRKGSAKDEERYDRLVLNPAKVASAQSAVAGASAPPAHDATGGRKRRRPVRRAVLTLVVLGGLAVAGALGLDQVGLLPESIDRWLPEIGGTTDELAPAQTPAP